MFPLAVTSASIDLDGTLLDTALDIAFVANAMLAELGLPLRSETEVRNFVGRGIPVTVERCLPEDKRGAETMETALASFKRHYAMNNGKYAKLYPGVLAGLNGLRARGIRLACVTNKAAAFSEPLLQTTGLMPYFEFVFSGDSLPEKKPHPMPLLLACERLSSQPASHLHIGDSKHDAAAARAAGCISVTLPYGYNEGEDVHSMLTDVIVPDIEAVLALIK